MAVVFGVGFRNWAGLGGAIIPALSLPAILRHYGSPAPVVEVDDDGLTLTSPGHLHAPLRIDRDEVASVVPLWLRPRGFSLLRLRNDLLSLQPEIPVIGAPRPPRQSVVAIVLRKERQVREARRALAPALLRGIRPDKPIRALLLAVDDLTEAQRPFLRWPGALQSLDDDTWEWLEGRKDRA